MASYSNEPYEYFELIFLDTLKDPYDDIPIEGTLSKRPEVKRKFEEVANKKVICLCTIRFTTGMQCID